MSPEVWLIIFLLLVAVLGCASVLLWRSAKRNLQVRGLDKRLRALSVRRKLRLAWALAKDRRIRRTVRLIPFLLLLYLAMPLDIIPDFIPVIGQADDLLVLAIGAGLMVRFTPPHVLEEHLSRLERETGPVRGAAELDPVD